MDDWLIVVVVVSPLSVIFLLVVTYLYRSVSCYNYNFFGKKYASHIQFYAL